MKIISIQVYKNGKLIDWSGWDTRAQFQVVQEMNQEELRVRFPEYYRKTYTKKVTKRIFVKK